MRRLRKAYLVPLFCGALLLSACGTRPLGGSIGSGSTAPLTTAITAPFTLGITNNPPAGVTVLSFQITITGAVLQPGNVSLINSPVTVELTQLQTDNDLLASLTVAAGSYTSLTLTFANPDMTIFNGSVPGLTNCAVGGFCEFAPVLSVTSITLTPTLTLTSDTPETIEIAFSVNDSLQSDLSLNLTSGVTVEELPSVTSDAVSFPLNTVAGVISQIGTNQFTLNTLEGASLTVDTTTSTLFSFPSTVCAADNATCLATGEIISADMIVLGSGAIQANMIIFEDNSGDPGIQGTIVALNLAASPPQLSIVIHGQAPATTGVAIDNLATVSLQNLTTYAVDADVLTIPSGFTFASTADLVVGQEVLVLGNTITVTPVSGEPNQIAISTDQLILRQSQWTANVGLIDEGNSAFSLTSLPDLFTSLAPTPINSLYMTTSAVTEFNFSNLTSLSAGTSLSVKGLVFNNTSNEAASPSDVASIVTGAPDLTQPAGAAGRGAMTSHIR
ncbi:MAG: hypothetical protein WA002_08640 [Candidatus Acidiferrales bacterium]